MVSAWAGEEEIILGQVAVDEKSNEIVAIPKVLDLLDIRGAVVTIDDRRGGLTSRDAGKR